MDRRSFLKLIGVGASTALAPAAAIAEPKPNTLVFTGDLGGGIMEFVVEEPSRVLINRVEYYVYEWEHVLGFLSHPDPLIRGQGEWEAWWRDRVCYDRVNKEVLIPMAFNSSAPCSGPPGEKCGPIGSNHQCACHRFWGGRWEGDRFEHFMPKTFIDRWFHLQAIHTDLYTPSAELSRAMFSNPKLHALARRWRRKQKNKT